MALHVPQKKELTKSYHTNKKINNTRHTKTDEAERHTTTIIKYTLHSKLTKNTRITIKQQNTKMKQKRYKGEFIHIRDGRIICI